MEIEKIQLILGEDLGLTRTQPLLIGLSGGPDSLCLLHLAIGYEFPLIAAHLDHGLRETSAQDSAIVKEFCAELAVTCVVKRIDVLSVAKQKKLSIEEAARNTRYRFLFETAVEQKAQAVLVAHHADDQVETILMHLLRGSGASGLRGMQPFVLPNAWSQTIPLIRPLLHVWRSEIADYCREHNLHPITDESNQDIRIQRNRIRKQLIPELESYNGNFRRNLLRTAEILQEEDKLLDNQMIDAWGILIRRRGKHFLVLDKFIFNTQPIAIQRRLVRAMIEEINSNIRDIEYDLVERVRDFALNGNSANYMQLFKGMELFGYRRDALVIGKGKYEDLWPQMTTSNPIPISEIGEIALGDKFWMQYAKLESREIDKSPWSAHIDAASLSGQLTLRTFQPGDKFMPFGLDGRTQKLGDFWTNEGLPAKARALWPLLCDDLGIIWVPGFRIAHRCHVTPQSKSILKFKVVER